MAVPRGRRGRKRARVVPDTSTGSGTSGSSSRLDGEVVRAASGFGGARVVVAVGLAAWAVVVVAPSMTCSLMLVLRILRLA